MSPGTDQERTLTPRITRKRVVSAILLIALVTAAYFIWTFLPTTVRVRGNDPRILIGSVYTGPGEGYVGQLAYNEGCLYLIRFQSRGTEPLGQQDVALPRSSRPVVIDGVPGIQIGDEVILVGQYFLGGGISGTPRPMHQPPPDCDPSSEGKATFNIARKL